jgi:hypothetical protein
MLDTRVTSPWRLSQLLSSTPFMLLGAKLAPTGLPIFRALVRSQDRPVTTLLRDRSSSFLIMLSLPAQALFEAIITLSSPDLGGASIITRSRPFEASPAVAFGSAACVHRRKEWSQKPVIHPKFPTLRTTRDAQGCSHAVSTITSNTANAKQCQRCVLLADALHHRAITSDVFCQTVEATPVKFDFLRWQAFRYASHDLHTVLETVCWT